MKNQINIFSLSKRIGRPWILDGAMGSLLQSKHKSAGSLWMSLVKQKEIFDIHKKYIDSGADIITTNTFRTNPAAVKRYGKFSSEKLVKQNLDIAKEAAKNLPIIIAGSNPPAEDCYQIERTISQKELKYNHQKHIDLLMENGAHFILNETQSHPDEIGIISEYCSKNEIPFIVSLFINENQPSRQEGLTLLSGEKIEEIINFILDYNPLAIGFNCIQPSTFNKLLKKLNLAKRQAELKFNWGFYLNCGGSAFTDKIIERAVSPNQYASIVKNSLRFNPSFIGACCGSSPDHTKIIKKVLDE